MRGGRATVCTLVLAAAVVAVAVWPAAAAPPRARRTSEAPLPAYDNQGVARVPDGWVLSGTAVLVRVDEQLSETTMITSPIPPDLASQGYNHVGDVDVVGDVVYAPFEQSDYTRGVQAIGRYDANTLAFQDAVTVAQNEASFVTVDQKTMIAYSMDNFGGRALLRYDVRKAWKRLPPLRMSRFVGRVQGADVARGAVWLSTDDETNGLYRVDLATGRVRSLGSAGHLPGEGEGIDATPLPSGLLHVLTIDPDVARVWFANFDVSTAPRPSRLQGGGRVRDSATLDSSWPPVLVGGALVVAASAVGAIVIMMRRARAALRSTSGGR